MTLAEHDPDTVIIHDDHIIIFHEKFIPSLYALDMDKAEAQPAFGKVVSIVKLGISVYSLLVRVNDPREESFRIAGGNLDEKKRGFLW